MEAINLVLLFCTMFFVKFEVEAGKSGPFTIKFEQVSYCNDVGTKEVLWTSLNELDNGNYRAVLSVKKPIDKNFKMCVEAREFISDGSTRVHQFNCKTCGQIWSIAGDYLTNVMTAAGLNPEECTIPVGIITANNWNASQPPKFLSKMTYNKYQFNASYYGDGVKLGCNIVDVEFLPASS